MSVEIFDFAVVEWMKKKSFRGKGWAFSPEWNDS